MFTLKSSPHIPSSRNIKSFHCGRTSTGLPMGHVDTQRLYREKIVLAGRMIRLSWLARQWRKHLLKVETQRFFHGEESPKRRITK